MALLFSISPCFYGDDRVTNEEVLAIRRKGRRELEMLDVHGKQKLDIGMLSAGYKIHNVSIMGGDFENFPRD